ncbi:MAG: PAS domain S-box protein [Chloroflexota bacterium]|nr:PAS domain S-box protein [Chloroflexota bacterium]
MENRMEKDDNQQTSTKPVKRSLFSSQDVNTKYGTIPIYKDTSPSFPVSILERDASFSTPPCPPNQNPIQGFQGIADSKGRLQFASVTHVEWMGYTAEEILWKPFWEASWFAQSPESQSTIKDSIWKALGGVITQCHAHVCTKDGIIYPAVLNINPLQGQEGDILSITAESATNRQPQHPSKEQSFMPFETRVAAEEQALLANIQDSEKIYTKLLEQAGDGIGIYQDGRLVYANPKLVEISKRRGLEIDKQVLTEILSPESADLIAKRFQKRLAGEEIPDVLEIDLIAANGITVPLEFNITLIEFQEKPAGMFIVRDITDRRKADLELKEVMERYSLVVEQGNDGVLIIKDLEIIFANERIIEMVGYTREEVQEEVMKSGGSTQDLLFSIIGASMSPDQLQERIDSYHVTMAEDTSPRISEIEVCKKDGTKAWLELNSTFIQYERGVADLILIRDITERKKAEQLLQQSEARFRALIENAADAIAVLSADGTISYESPSVERLLGYSPDDLIGKWVLDLIHPDDQASILSLFEKYLDAFGECVSLEVRIKTKNGDWHWFEVIAQNLLNNPHVQGVVVNYRDITERKQTEEKLLYSETRFQLLTENISDAIAIIDSEGTIRYETSSAERILGYKPEELVGKNGLEFIHPDDLPKALGVFSDIMAIPNTRASMEVRYLHKDGSWVWAEMSGQNLLDNTHIHGIVVNYHDITERKRTEQALRESEERYSTMVERSNDGILIISLSNFKAEFGNKRIADMLGYTLEEGLGSSILEFINPDDIPNIFQKQQQLVDDAYVFSPSELNLVHKDGHLIPVETNSAAIEYQGEKALVTFIRDITDRRQAESQKEALLNELSISYEKLRQSNQELQDFAYVASHDLREPLRKISAFGEILSSSISDKLDEDDKDNLDFMIDGANRMQQMINALLDYSRITTKAKDFHNVDLNEVINDIRELELAVQLEETKGVIEIPESLPFVHADEIQIHQLMHNLISNGLKYQRKDSTPIIAVRAVTADHNQLLIEVEDNGVGIPEEHRDEVFNMFRRLHSRSEYSGTGIGLAICKKIVQRHGGEIGIKPSSSGGSTFWFTLPSQELKNV